MSIHLKLELGGKDSVFFSFATRLVHGLATLLIYRNVPDRVTNWDQLKAALDTYGSTMDSSHNGDRGEIAKRKMARKALSEMFKKVRDYLQSIATEDDIPALIEAGFQIVQRSGRKKSSNVSAA